MELMKQDYYAAMTEAPRVKDHIERLYQHHVSLSDELQAVHELVVRLAVSVGLDAHVREYEADGHRIRPDEMPGEPTSVHEALDGIQKLVFAMNLGRPNERVRDIRTLLDQLTDHPQLPPITKTA